MNSYTHRRIKQIAYQVLIDITIWLERERGRMITPKDTIGYIQRYRDSEGNETFSLIEAKVKKVVIGKTKTSVYTKEFYPLDAEEIESNTKIIDTSKGFLLVGEPFLLKEGDSDYFKAVVDHCNTYGAKHWWEE